MNDPNESACLACPDPITGDDFCRQRNSATGEWAMFHTRCWNRILERRRETRDAALQDIAARFERSAEGPDGFDAHVPNWPYARFDNEAFQKLASPAILSALVPWVPADGSLILSARTGAGKSAACVAKLYQLRAKAEAAGNSKLLPWFMFVTAAQLSGARRHQKLGTGESILVERAMCVDLLVLDEIGFEPLDGVSFEVIDTRYRKQKPTVVTTGLNPTDFSTRYGSAVWRRLTETGDVVEDHGGRKLAVAR